MHHLALNVTDIMIGLLRGTFHCSATDSVHEWPWACFREDEDWQAHGQLIADSLRYIPGSFDRPPRNPADKISSGYKAWEFMYYFYVLLPGFLWSALDPVYFRHLCKLIAGARFALLFETPIQFRPYYHKLLIEFVEQFEKLYYKRRIDRLHFCRHSIHLLTHLIPENIRVGPAWLHSQWALESAIGNLTREIGSHVKPYANLAERGSRRAQVNALYALFPELANEKGLPKGAVVLGGDYILLEWARDKTFRELREPLEANALIAFLRACNVVVPASWVPVVWKWARLQLPTGQIARTAWRELKGEERGKPVRRSRMIKVSVAACCTYNNRFGEVQYFFRIDVPRANGGSETLTLAMVSWFTPLDISIADKSHGVLLACQYQGDRSREVIDVKEIRSVVGMVPLPPRDSEKTDPHFATKYAD
ncbi:hypothetical protein C8Q76DRAFT_590502, partial [Earliella scabrosa]